MYEITQLTGILEKVAELDAQVDALKTDKTDSERVQVLRKEGEENPWLRIYSEKLGSITHYAHSAAWHAKYFQKTHLKNFLAWADRAERFETVVEELGLDEEKLPLLEKLVDGNEYKSERDSLIAQIKKTLNTVQETEWGIERDEAVKKLEEAGFTSNNMGLVLVRGKEAVKILDLKFGPTWGFKFIYTKDGTWDDSISGGSGEFRKLFEAVGIPQEVPASA
jgi:hypothetical protein